MPDTIHIDLKRDSDIKSEVLKDLEIPNCFQCQRCSVGCPLRDEFDLFPHQVIRLVQLGFLDEVYHSNTLWLCISCETCYSRCPQEVDFPSFMDEVRQLSERLEKKPSIPEVPAFDRLFLFTIRRFGRLFELGFMTLYKLFSFDLFRDLSRLPEMLIKGKLSLLPHFSGDRRELRDIFKRIRSEL